MASLSLVSVLEGDDDENVAIVTRGYTSWFPWLGDAPSDLFKEAVVSEQLQAAIADVMRALLDVRTKYADHDSML